MPAQVRKTAEAALEAIDGGMCVVIGLQSTGEANTSASLEEQGNVLEDFVSGEHPNMPPAPLLALSPACSSNMLLNNISSISLNVS